MNEKREITELLRVWQAGDESVTGELVGLIQKDLRQIVRKIINRPPNRGAHFQTTEMMNELFLRLLSGPPKVDYENRSHFYALCGRLLRQVLVDLSRERKALKRGKGVADLSLDLELISLKNRPVNIAELEDALLDFEKIDPEKAELVELRFYAGLSHEEIAELRNVSLPTVKRHWKIAKAWLFNYLSGKSETES